MAPDIDAVDVGVYEVANEGVAPPWLLGAAPQAAVNEEQTRKKKENANRRTKVPSFRRSRV